VQNIFWFWISI